MLKVNDFKLVFTFEMFAFKMFAFKTFAFKMFAFKMFTFKMFTSKMFTFIALGIGCERTYCRTQHIPSGTSNRLCSSHSFFCVKTSISTELWVRIS